jgi:hypothetical protein
VSRSTQLWLVPALSFGLGAAGLALLVATPAERLPPPDRLDAADVLFPLGFFAYAAVGALIAARHPRNPVGWLFCLVGLALPLSGLLWAYATYSVYTEGGELPAEEALAWAYAWSNEPLLVVLVLLLLLFPNGRFLSSRWRRLGEAAIASALVWAVAIALQPGALTDFGAIENPFGVDAAGFLEELAAVASSASFLFFVGAGVSVVVRYRRAAAAEQLQIKWLAAAGAFAAAMVLAFTVAEAVTVTSRGAMEIVTSALAFLAVAVIPVGVGVAMLRHRLYDIDVVVNRTLVYGSVTAVLAAAYLGLVLLFQLAFSPVTEGNGLAVALSTLAVAALFRPARNRVQALVDRRFYRQRYDAQQTLDGFASRLREEVDLDALREELTGVVAQTMRPAHVSLWLKEAL